MRQFAAMVTATLMAFTSVSAAADSPVVVELYTSQGCSSCPPADAHLTQLADRDDVIALALHVDYWDYIGWKDEFADAKFTRRQKAYANAAGHSSIYTPQIIINGVEHVVGNRRKDVALIIRQHAKKTAPVQMTLARENGELSIAARAETALSGPVMIQVVRYDPRKSVYIRSGENAGKEIVYSNIVTEWQNLGEWDPRNPLNLSVKIKGDQPVVVILQRPGPGQIIGTARLR